MTTSNHISQQTVGLWPSHNHNHTARSPGMAEVHQAVSNPSPPVYVFNSHPRTAPHPVSCIPVNTPTASCSTQIHQAMQPTHPLMFFPGPVYNPTSHTIGQSTNQSTGQSTNQLSLPASYGQCTSNSLTNNAFFYPTNQTHPTAPVQVPTQQELHQPTPFRSVSQPSITYPPSNTSYQF